MHHGASARPERHLGYSNEMVNEPPQIVGYADRNAPSPRGLCRPRTAYSQANGSVQSNARTVGLAAINQRQVLSAVPGGLGINGRTSTVNVVKNVVAKKSKTIAL